MWTRLLRTLLATATVWLLNKYRQTSLELIKLEAAIGYVKSVRSARKAFLAVLAVVLGAGLLVAGFLLLHIGLGMLLYLAFKNWWAVGTTLLALGILYTLAPLFVIRRLCAEKTWMRFFKADKLVEQVTKKS
ncbi:MAG: hypothetical protein PHW60_09610 [Kiritimatiellae bacterium]|nr:hypothetical protein [Kiritimatiellia bacterium]